MWKCKYCIFDSAKRGVLLKHYRLKHGAHTKTVPFPCLHNDCLCTFNSISCLKVHLAKIHTKTLAENMFSFKAYPTNDDYAQVAAALVNKHPCLLESGSSTGWGILDPR